MTNDSRMNQAQANIQVIKDYYAAYAARDLDKIKQFVALNIVWRIPDHPLLADEKQSADEVAAFFTQLSKGNFRAA